MSTYQILKYLFMLIYVNFAPLALDLTFNLHLCIVHFQLKQGDLDPSCAQSFSIKFVIDPSRFTLSLNVEPFGK